MSEALWIIGAAMTPFGRFPTKDTIDLSSEAAMSALADGQVGMQDIGVVAVGSVFELDPLSQLLDQIGRTTVPGYNLRSACASGAAAVRTVSMAIKAGEADVGLAVGVEQLGKSGLLGMPEGFTEESFASVGRHEWAANPEGVLGSFTMPAVFSFVSNRYAADNDGVGLEQFAKVAVKNHRNSVLNPLAQYRKELTMEEVLSAPMVAYPNTLPMCCPTGDGGAAVVVASDAFVRRADPDVRRRAVKISASVLRTDGFGAGPDAVPNVNDLTRSTARDAYEMAGIGPDDLDLVELHDCFASAELVHYDNLGLCEPGGAGAFIDQGHPERGGRIPVNVSGGLLSKGHPVGATGVANLYEVVTHLRGEAGDRQVDGARVGLTHVMGLEWTCAVHILERSAPALR